MATGRRPRPRRLRVIDRTVAPQALDEHCARLAACRQCTPHDGSVRPIVPEARRPRAMLVGQAPGQTEAGGGRAFAGRAGGTLFRWFAHAGLTEREAREHLWIAAVTRCYPGPSPGGRGDRVPSPAERACCRGWLDAELRLLRPPLIVLVGRLAIDALLGPLPLGDVVGTVREIEHAGGRARVVALPHPSGASSWIHAPGHGALLERALAELRRELAAIGVPLERTTGRSVA